MPTLITDAERNADADRAAEQIKYLSVHTASTELTGTAEATGGDPPYARKPVTFNAAGTAGPLGETLQPATVGVAWSSQAVFDVAAGTYTHWGAWDTLTGGVFKRGNDLSTVQNPTGQSVFALSIGVGPYSGV